MPQFVELKNLQGERSEFRRRAAIADIIFYAKIFVRATGVVAGGKNQPTKSVIFSYDV
jgi:hypothetical protein